MSVHEEITTWAWILAIVAASNWAFGNRSVFGWQLILRPGRLWRMIRWAGLAVSFGAVAIHTQAIENHILSAGAILGALLMLVGTARKRDPRPPQRRAEQDTGGNAI